MVAMAPADGSDVAGLDEIESRLDQGLSDSLTSYDAAVLRARHINGESDGSSLETID